jgi:MYXO-CTERM domain-containing protein
MIPSLALVASALAAPRVARADNVLHPGSARADRPTVTTLGVQWPITGDDDFDATVSVRYRVAGTSGWRDAMPLVRVHPEAVVGMTIEPQFAGSIFDLQPGTAYEIELHAVDSDGSVDQTTMLTSSTRAVPRAEPTTARTVNVTDAASLRAALNGARAGDVITLADGMYAGEFSINASGTADDPIVIRGASRDGTILDGGNGGGNVLEVYGSFVHIERLTLQHDNRALRFQGMGATDNVVRRVHIRDVVLGIGAQDDQRDFYLCDNVVDGRLSWPSVYADDGGAHANDDGIRVNGDGHVVCHNEIHGFGDAMKVEQDGSRAVDFYGNEVTSAYDNGLELDATSGNARAFRNRFVNTYATLSFQPIYGGPAYALRNVIVNVAHEQLKLHSLGGTMVTSGIVVLHNTFVSPDHAYTLEDSTMAHYVTIENNLWVGPAMPANGRVANWDAPIDSMTNVIDSNGWYPDGQFQFGYGATGATYASFAALVAGGRYETHGVLLATPIFANGLVGPRDYHAIVDVAAADVTLATGSNAIDRGVRFANVNDAFEGSGPDLGALERGCAVPLYGVRPEGMDESNEVVGCGGTTMPGSDGGVGDAGAIADAGGAEDASRGVDAARVDGSRDVDGGGDAGPATMNRGCGCHVPGQRDSRDGVTWLFALASAVAIARRRRSRAV